MTTSVTRSHSLLGIQRARAQLATSVGLAEQGTHVRPGGESALTGNVQGVHRTTGGGHHDGRCLNFLLES